MRRFSDRCEGCCVVGTTERAKTKRQSNKALAEMVFNGANYKTVLCEMNIDIGNDLSMNIVAEVEEYVFCSSVLMITLDNGVEVSIDLDNWLVEFQKKGIGGMLVLELSKGQKKIKFTIPVLNG